MEYDMIYNVTNTTSHVFTTHFQDTVHRVARNIILGVAVFGILGNIINIYVLTHKRTCRWSRGSLEVVAYTGLVALAVSDMIFCTMTAIDSLFVDRRRIWHKEKSALLIIQYYSKYILNVFSYFSTWLTVLMALNRYLAICYPIYTRICVRRNLLWKVMLVIFISWAILLLPELLEDKICHLKICEQHSFDSFDDDYYYNYNTSLANFTDSFNNDCGCIPSNTSETIYQIQAGPTEGTKFLTVSQVFNHVVGFIAPAIIMIYCNCNIVLKLRETRLMRREFVSLDIRECRSSNHTTPDKPVTYSLFMVVLLFLILVTPSEVLNIVIRYFHRGYTNRAVLNTFVEIANILNNLNFATNFLLYCLVNVHFRRTLKTMFCRKRRRVSREMSFMMCTRATSVDLL